MRVTLVRIRGFHTITSLRASQLLTLKQLEAQLKGGSDSCLIQVMAKQRIHSVKKITEKEDRLNATKSLAQLRLIQGKSAVLQELERERPDLVPGQRKQLTLYWRILKCYLVFFKEGIANVWHTYKKLKNTVYRKRSPYYIFDNGLGRNDQATGNSKDKKTVVRRWSLDKVVAELATAVRSQHNVQGEKMWMFEGKNDRSYIDVSRSQLQSMLRNKYDMPRLPAFAFLFALLEEMTFIVCWISPYITPTTCVFPAFMPRYFSRCINAQKKLEEIRKGVALEEVAGRNPYSMNAEELRLVSELLMVNSSFKLANWLENNDFMRRKLLQRYKEIAVDNYLIVRDGGVDQLNTLELFYSCLRRGLIDFEALTKKIQHSRTQDYTEYINKAEMRAALRKFIVEFNDRRNNVGLLGLYTTCK